MIAALAVVLALQAERYEDHLGLEWESLRVSGSIGVEVWHDDNILLTRDDEETDVVTVLVPELRLRAGGDDLGARLDYRGRDRHFLDHRRLNGMEHAFDGEAHGRWGALRASAWDRFEVRREPFGVPGGTERLDWLVNDAGLDLEARFGRVLVEASGVHRFHEMREDAFDFFDHRRWEAALRGGYEISARVDLLAEAGVGHTEYRTHRDLIDDFSFRWYAGGVRGFLRDNLQVHAKAGAFRVSTDNTSGAAVTESDAGLYASAALAWQPTDSGDLRLEVQRRPVESIFSGWTLALRAEATYSQRLLDRVTIALGGYWERLDESADGEDRTAWGAHAGATYAVSRHFAIGVRGEMRAKGSDDDTFEYDNRRASVGATVSW